MPRLVGLLLKVEKKQRFWFVCFLEQTHKPLALFAVKSKANWSSTVRFALLTGAVTTVSKPEQRFCFVCSDYLLGCITLLGLRGA